jgi:endo-1,4-beta-xylanase
MFLRFLFAIAMTHSSFSATLPDGGRDLLPADWPGAVKAPNKKLICQSQRADFGTHGQGWRVEVLDEKSSLYQVQLSTTIDGEVKKGDRLLIVFDARCLKESSVDGKGRAQVVVEMKNPPDFVKLGQDAVDISSEWQTLYVPFPANADSKSGITHASLMLGGKKQTLEVSNMRLLNYGSAFDLTKLPRPSIQYPGREADAPWRTEALARIEKIRTTEIAVEVVDAAGRPQSQAKVSLALKRHSFGFGTAVKAKYLMGTDETSAKYRALVDDNFSAIVLENDLKPFAWTNGASNDRKDYRQEWTLGALAWAKGRGMKTRGHYLCWGPWEAWSEKLKDQPSAIRERIMSHMDQVIHGAAGLVDEWDAVNHPAGWESPRSTVDQVVSPDLYAEVFKAARTRTGVPLWINEDQVFREGRQQDEYYECIKGLIAQGARPDGIGNQAHFHSSHLPGGPEMLRISDRFAALVPNLELTEFDVITNGDEQLQADWLRDTLIMAYSHPAYSAMMLWVFWEGAGWKPETALWRTDWSEKPNAKVWRELVCKLWRTQASGQTDSSGIFATRGHRGLYEITVEMAGKTTVMPFNTEHGSGMIRVVVP